MAHRESTEEQQFRPSRRYIDPKDHYRFDDYLTGPANESIPEVGSASSPRRNIRRPEAEIRPSQDREEYERQRAERARIHAEMRRERLRQLNECKNHVNGFGEQYVPIQRVYNENQSEVLKRESMARLRQGPARYFGDISAKRPQEQYSSDIGFSRFGLAAAGNDVVQSPRRQYNHAGVRSHGNIIAHDETPQPAQPPRPTNRNTSAFTTSNNWLAEDSPAPQPTRPQRRTFYHGRNVDIISGVSKPTYPVLSGVQVTEDVPVAPPPSGIHTFSRRYAQSDNPIAPKPVELPKPPAPKPTAMSHILSGVPVAPERPRPVRPFVNNIY